MAERLTIDGFGRAVDKATNGGSTLDLVREAERARSAEEEKDAEIQRLRAALKPFAEVARACVERAEAKGLKDYQSAIWTPQSTRFVEATFADCRAVLKALEGT